MYGTVKPFTPDLLVRENEYYKSVYCGLCRSMGKHTTVVSCASLTFDMTFFALVRIWITRERGEIVMKRCPAHPMRRRPMMKDNPALEYTSYVSAYLTYNKILDDIRDERGIKRFFARIALMFAKSPVKKIPPEIAPVGEKIRGCLDKLSLLEMENCDSPSEAADTFGELLGFAASFGLDGESARIAEELGRHVGKWVYLADAACDIDDDDKSGSYNPFLAAMGFSDAKEFIKSGLDGVLGMELIGAVGAYELGPSDMGECGGCIKNILTKGMRSALREKLEKNNEGKHERSV
ncbi:MAG: hypothetical protein IKI51_02315 [Clostridia bacterium]|nr:hypothetical protein [Clostridia bacterium]